MNPSELFLLQAFVIVWLPVVLLRVTGLRGIIPLVVVQSFAACRLPSWQRSSSDTLLDCTSPLAPSPAAIASFGYWPRQMSLSCESNGKFSSPWLLAQSS